MATAKVYAALAQLNGLDAVSSSGAQQTEDRRAAVLAHLGDLFAEIISLSQTPELPTFSGDRRENIHEFLNDMERHFVSCSIPEDEQLRSLSKQLRGEAAKFWADYQYFVTDYDKFVQALFEDFATPQAWADRKAEIDSRLKKKEDEATPSVPQEETQTATPASTNANIKYEAELEPSQRETKVTQRNAYTTAASEKLDTTAENDNDTTVALPTTRAAEDEVIVKEERPADFNNKGPLDNDNTQEEEPERTTAAEEKERPAETANDEVEEEDGILESKVGEREMQVLPTAQCDLRPMKSDPRQRGGTHANGGSAESINHATPGWKRARRDPSDHSRRRSRYANTGIPRARHAEDELVSKRVRPTSDAELEPSQRETKVTQRNAYTTAASEKLDTTAENDNDTTVALPTTRAAEDEVIVKEERPADFNNKGPLDNDNTQEEEPERTTAAEEKERPAETANDEVEEEDGILESKVGEREMQVLPTAQCDLRPMKSDPRQRGGTHANGGSAESINHATPGWKRARRDPSDHSRRRSRYANTGIPRARHAEDELVSKRVRPTSDGNSATIDSNNTVKVPAAASRR
ncbi:hypothetical protein FQA39_LY02838 [Lamprigera yunnana]|nr:hypothetical protein FQA39_LY02838 [Lamprigera yunnana]